MHRKTKKNTTLKFLQSSNNINTGVIIIFWTTGLPIRNSVSYGEHFPAKCVNYI